VLLARPTAARRLPKLQRQPQPSHAGWVAGEFRVDLPTVAGDAARVSVRVPRGLLSPSSAWRPPVRRSPRPFALDQALPGCHCLPHGAFQSLAALYGQTQAVSDPASASATRASPRVRRGHGGIGAQQLQRAEQVDWGAAVEPRAIAGRPDHRAQGTVWFALRHPGLAGWPGGRGEAWLPGGAGAPSKWFACLLRADCAFRRGLSAGGFAQPGRACLRVRPRGAA
jgi:hypothetical protein